MVYMAPNCRVWGLLLLALLIPLSVTSREYRVDDSDPAFFTLTGPWNVITPNHPCDTCAVKADAQQVYMGTYHDTGAGRGAGVVKFRGSAISLFGIAVNREWQGNLEWRIDGGATLRSDVPDDGTHNLRYGELLVRVTDLDPSQEHTLEFEPRAKGLKQGDLIFVDYAIITVPDEPIVATSSANHLPTSTSTSETTSRTPDQPSPTGVSSSSTTIEATGNSRNTTSTSPDTIVAASTSAMFGPPEARGSTTLTTTQTIGPDLALSTGSSPHSVNRGAIAGGVVGGLVMTALILFVWLCHFRHRRHSAIQSLPDAYAVDPGMSPMSSIPISRKAGAPLVPTHPTAFHVIDDALLNRVRELEDQLAEANSRSGVPGSEALPPPYA